MYKKAKTKTDKGKIIVDLCKQLIVSSPTKTGFVKLDTKTGRWFFIGYEKSKDKVGHALRKATSRSKALKSKPQEQEQQQSKEVLGDAGQHRAGPPGTSREEDTQNAFRQELLSSSIPHSDSSDSGGPASRSKEVNLPSAASLPAQRTTQQRSNQNGSSVLHYVIGESPAEEPKQNYPKQSLQIEGSPVRRSMFDSPYKHDSARMSSVAVDENVAIPLPLSSAATTGTNDHTTESIAADRPQSQASGSFPPGPYPHPHYYYPPPGAYVYYPVPVHYGSPYPPPPPGSYPSYYPPCNSTNAPPDAVSVPRSTSDRAAARDGPPLRNSREYPALLPPSDENNHPALDRGC